MVDVFFFLVLFFSFCFAIHSSCNVGIVQFEKVSVQYEVGLLCIEGKR